MEQSAQTNRQLYPPIESPYEVNVGGQRPNQVFPPDSDYPLAAGDPGFLLGTVLIEMPGVPDVLIQADVPYPLRLQKSDVQEGIITGDISEVPDSMPDFFWASADYHRVQAMVNDNRLLVVQYRDFAQKHPALRRPYRVAVVVEYVERHPDIEALTDPLLRQRIYNDLLRSEYSMVAIDPERYKADPDYSAMDDLRAKANAFFDGAGHYHPSVESYLVTNETL